MPDTKEIFQEILEELNKLKNLYPYSNNNELYNKVIDICILKIEELLERKLS